MDIMSFILDTNVGFCGSTMLFCIVFHWTGYVGVLHKNTLYKSYSFWPERIHFLRRAAYD
jgi:hypothetical protein